MRKFLAVVRHEYRKIIMRWAFLIGTFVMPLMLGAFSLVPVLIFSLNSETTRVAVVDRSGKILPRLKNELSRSGPASAKHGPAGGQSGAFPGRDQSGPGQAVTSFELIEFDANGKPPERLRNELVNDIRDEKFDAYLLIPEDISSGSEPFEFRSKKGGDFVANDALKDALERAVFSQRLADANINEAQLKQLDAGIDLDAKGLDEKGRETDSEMLMAGSFIIGLMIYITLAIYGQVIMGAVVEEKDTRIAEILFSSARPFELMLGKLVGVGLAGLTQLGIWMISLVSIIGYLSTRSDPSGLFRSLPHITPLMILYFLLFFLLGYFVFASIYALIGSMVTSVQEGGQFAFPVTIILVAGYFFSMVVMRDPSSSISVVVSILPFFGPITMPVRILAGAPPLWQIFLSIIFNIAAIIGLVLLASRVYRVGMLMYGKRATIPEVWKWIRQP